MRISLGKRIRCLSVWLCCFVRSALIVVCCVYVAVNGFALTLKTMCEGWILRQICITSSEQHRYPFDEQHRSTDVWFFVFSVCMSLWVSVCQMLRARIWIICLHWISSFFSCSSIIIAPHTDADLTIIMAAIIIAIWTWISIINFLERALARVCVCAIFQCCRLFVPCIRHNFYHTYFKSECFRFFVVFLVSHLLPERGCSAPS